MHDLHRLPLQRYITLTSTTDRVCRVANNNNLQVIELVKKYYKVKFLKRNPFHKLRANVAMERFNAIGTLSVGCKPQTIISKVMLVM
jgi:hypothetical protein